MGCGTARITRVATKVAEALDHLADPAAGVTVERVYAPDWLDQDYWRDNPDLQDSFTGRRVYVFGVSQKQVGPASRGEDFNDYGVTVVVLERYTGDEPEVPNEWLDERVAWVESEVYDYLGDAREIEDPAVPDAEPQGQDWTQVYSPALLRELKLFRSEVTITYRAVE